MPVVSLAVLQAAKLSSGEEDHLAALDRAQQRGGTPLALLHSPGSLKAELCRRGREMRRLLRRARDAYRDLGKVVVAADEDDCPAGRIRSRRANAVARPQ